MRRRIYLTWLAQAMIVGVVIWCMVWLIGLYRSAGDQQLSEVVLYEPSVRIDDKKEVLLFRLKNNIILGENVVAALGNSVPINFLLDFDFEKPRGWFGSQTLGADQHQITLRYNALLEQYIIERFLTSKPEIVSVDSYPDLNSALEFLINSQTIALFFDEPISEVDNPYQLNVKLSLDIDALPAPLRPYAFRRSAWTIDTSWVDWPVNLKS